MRQVFTVFAYTFKEGIRKKAFWVSTGIIMALIVLLCFAPRIITAFEAQESAKKNQAAGEIQTEAGKEGICYFIDETGVFEKNLAAFQAVYPDLLFQAADVSELETLKEDVAENEKHSIFYVEDQEGLPFFHVINTNFMKGINTELMVSELETLKEDVAENEKHSIFYVEDQEGLPFFHVINTNFMKGINTELMVETGTAVWQSAFLTGQGLSKETIAASQTPLGYAEEAAGTMSLTGYVLGLVMTFVMFFAVYYYGYGVAMSVASEKTSRVMETLIISAKPSRILIGKCLAMGAVGLLQLVGLLAMSVASEKTSRVMETLIISAKPSRILIGKCLAMGAVGLLQLVGLLGFGLGCYSILMPDGFRIHGIEISLSGFGAETILVLVLYFILGYALYAVLGLGCYSILMPDGFRIHGIEISLSGFGAETILVLVLYFILGYALYAVLNSVCGAAVSKVEDLNSAMMPVSIIVVIGFYLGYFTSVAGGGSNTLSKLALYLPISSPFAVPFKILTGDIATQELLISMGILAAAIVVVAALSARIYSVSVMHYGNLLKWKDLRKMKTN